MKIELDLPVPDGWKLSNYSYGADPIKENITMNTTITFERIEPEIDTELGDELKTSNIKPYMDMISNLKMENQSLKAHAVEVVAKLLDRIEQKGKYESWEEEVNEITKDRIRAEACALLGWEE